MWQKLRAFRMVMVAIVGILGVAIADISNFNGFIAASKEFTEYLQREFGVPFGGVSGAVVLILTVVILVILLRKKLPLHRATTANKASIARDNIRRAYLHYMKREIDNRLMASLHGATFLDLRADERPNAVLPWHFVATSPNHGPRVFTRADDALRDFDGRILLLGPPGAGKTTTILQIASRLVDEAASNPKAPVPLIESFSQFQDLEFSSKRFALIKWLGKRVKWLGRLQAAEDNERYATVIQGRLARLIGGLRVSGLNSSVVEQWIEQCRVAFVLDGLDEMEETQRAALVKCLNATLLDKYGSALTVITSRSFEYEKLERSTELLRLDGAVTLQPLSIEQVEHYLRRTGADFLAGILHLDSALQELATNPLTLSVMALTYQGLTTVEPPKTTSLLERRCRLFDAFIDRMMQRESFRRAGQTWDPHSPRVFPTLYTRETVNRFLGRLAIVLTRRMETRIPTTRISMIYHPPFHWAIPPLIFGVFFGLFSRWGIRRQFAA